VVGVEPWAEIRRMRLVQGLSIKEIHRLLHGEPTMPTTCIRELIGECGYVGGKRTYE